MCDKKSLHALLEDYIQDVHRLQTANEKLAAENTDLKSTKTDTDLKYADVRKKLQQKVISNSDLENQKYKLDYSLKKSKQKLEETKLQNEELDCEVKILRKEVEDLRNLIHESLEDASNPTDPCNASNNMKERYDRSMEDIRSFYEHTVHRLHEKLRVAHSEVSDLRADSNEKKTLEMENKALTCKNDTLQQSIQYLEDSMLKEEVNNQAHIKRLLERLCSTVQDLDKCSKGNQTLTFLKMDLEQEITLCRKFLKSEKIRICEIDNAFWRVPRGRSDESQNGNADYHDDDGEQENGKLEDADVDDDNEAQVD